MTNSVFYKKGNEYVGFSVAGHTADYDDEQARLVCASISSAVYLIANMITEVIKAKADITEQDGYFSLNLKDCVSQGSAAIEGLFIHLKQLSLQYENFINIKTEVL